ncbi:metal-dependent hydrolase [Nevskia sp.]|uniref:metal-dependent hydrolase n=1 Tax=Nevskia sp. TaxID=1929292 RepID=UPI003F6F8F25
MAEHSQHPMDHFPVRPLRFPLAADQPVAVVWSRTKPAFSVFLNALAMHVPHFERYLVASLRRAREQIRDPALKRDVTAIIGQEANHSHNLTAFNQHLRARYPEAVAIDDASIAWFARHAAEDDLKASVGFTAGYETFTFLAGMIILQHHDRWFADADPQMKALWVWHQVEEIEHGAVAFEVWQHLFGEHEWTRKWMVLKAALHIARETVLLYPRMARREGWLRSPWQAMKTLAFGGEMLGRLFLAALPVFSRRYHPRRHPIATTAQNPIQIAWRRYEASGGDVLAIDHAKLAAMLRMAPPAGSPMG